MCPCRRNLAPGYPVCEEATNAASAIVQCTCSLYSPYELHYLTLSLSGRQTVPARFANKQNTRVWGRIKPFLLEGMFIASKLQDTHITPITSLCFAKRNSWAVKAPPKKKNMHLLVVFAGKRVSAMVNTASNIITAPMIVNLGPQDESSIHMAFIMGILAGGYPQEIAGLMIRVYENPLVSLNKAEN